MEKEDLTLRFLEDIKQKIFIGEYKIGQNIPSLRQLSLEYGFSRSVINVGIARLESLGYLKIQKRQRIIVNDFLTKGSLDVVRDMAFSKNKLYKGKSSADILDARKLIEIESVKQAAIKEISPNTEILCRIVFSEEVMATMGNKNYIAIAEKDFEFHNQLIKLSDNIVYIAFMNVFKDTALKMTQDFYKKNIDLFDYYVKKHKKIAEAIKQKDSLKASLLLQEILEHGEKAYKDYNL